LIRRMSGKFVQKSQEERVSECLAVLKKLVDELGISAENPSIKLFKKRMSDYWRDGKFQNERIPLVGTNRYIMYEFPKWAHKKVEAMLHVAHVRLSFKELPSDLAAEIEAGTRNAPQSPSSQPAPLD
jgi:hypothetical protein